MKHLGPSERAVLEQVAVGMSDVEIARRRGMSRWTVRTQVDSIRRLLGIESREELAQWAYRSGWMTQTPDWALRRSA